MRHERFSKGMAVLGQGMKKGREGGVKAAICDNGSEVDKGEEDAHYAIESRLHMFVHSNLVGNEQELVPESSNRVPAHACSKKFGNSIHLGPCIMVEFFSRGSY